MNVPGRLALYKVVLLVNLALLHGGCTTPIETDKKAVVKIVTIREYLLLNEDFSKPNKQREQKSIKKYDVNGNLLEERNFWNDTPGGGMIYKYNEVNQKTEEYALDIHGDVYGKSEITYNGIQADQFEILKDGSKRKTKTFYLDSAGNIIREVNYNSRGGTMIDFRYRYNAKHEETERSGTMDGKVMPVNSKVYDSLSNLTKQYQSDSAGKVTWIEEFTYDFNDDGNWKNRRSVIDGKPHAIATQTIERKQ